MILRSLELNHFGKFGQRTFEFRKGMNLVAGPNEAGKSTLMEAIPAALFGVRDKSRFLPWGRHGGTGVALVLEGNGRTVRIERDIQSDHVQLTERDDLYQTLYHFEGKVAPGGRSSERAEYLSQLCRLLGIAEDEVFRASLFFGQGSLEPGRRGGIPGKIKSLLSGFVEVDYDKVLASLQEDHFAITRHNPWGKDKTKDREIEKVRERLGGLEKEWFAGDETARELEGQRASIEELRASIEADREEYAKGERYLAWVRKQWQLEEKEEILRRDFNRVNRQTEKVSELKRQRQELEGALGKTGLPRQIPGDLPVLLAEAEEVRKELISLQGEAASLREKLLAHRGPPWGPPTGLSFLFLVIGGGLAWIRPGWLVSALACAGIAILLVLVAYLLQAGRKRAERGRIQGQVLVLERKREEAQARLAGLDERFELLGMSPSAVEIVKMQKNLDRSRDLSRQLSEVESALKVLEEGEELSRDREDLTRELAVLDERLEQDKPLRSAEVMPLEDLPGAEEKLRALGDSIREREERLVEISQQEGRLQGRVTDRKRIEEEGGRLREREALLAKRQRALALGYDLLSEAVEDFRKNYLDKFAQDVGRQLKGATLGRYDKIKVGDDFSLALKTKSGDWQPVDRFSCGTVDAVYFAVRIALTRHLSRDRALPLFLDDPLVNMDSSRLGETFKVLERLGREHQILFFSHEERLLKYAAQRRWNVISLEPSTAPRIPVQERSEDVGQLHLL
ncbi:AAA family ATPase [uncultured Desulfuromonas sp.]|uniref:ATP-binding protein n=1 Tax=uncultured Desulfuromonas sp. TaxID=181013 RepID=UPI00261820E1|nr:AAA family ATPase [uncultured Desulfuromonas sp.]